MKELCSQILSFKKKESLKNNRKYLAQYWLYCKFQSSDDINDLLNYEEMDWYHFIKEQSMNTNDQIKKLAADKFMSAVQKWRLIRLVFDKNRFTAKMLPQENYEKINQLYSKIICNPKKRQRIWSKDVLLKELNAMKDFIKEKISFNNIGTKSNYTDKYGQKPKEAISILKKQLKTFNNRVFTDFIFFMINKFPKLLNQSEIKIVYLIKNSI